MIGGEPWMNIYERMQKIYLLSKTFENSLYVPNRHILILGYFFGYFIILWHSIQQGIKEKNGRFFRDS